MIYGNFIYISPHLFKDIFSFLIAVASWSFILLFDISQMQEKKTFFKKDFIYSFLERGEGREK